jgi:hypothetical protein
MKYPAPKTRTIPTLVISRGQNRCLRNRTSTLTMMATITSTYTMMTGLLSTVLFYYVRPKWIKMGLQRDN